LREKVSNFLSNVWVYTLVAAVFALFFYPMWSEDRMYMVEWVIIVSTATAAWAASAAISAGYPVIVIGVIAFWVYGLGVGVRTHAYAQLPCTAREKTTCTACIEEEVTQSGTQCLASEVYECEVCTERTWRSYEWPARGE
jgi:hypothetical protein